jgi:hypothetical protein
MNTPKIAADETAILPAGLRDARDQPAMSEFPEANAADAELTHVTVSTAAELASVVLLHLEFRGALRLFNQALLCQESPPSSTTNFPLMLWRFWGRSGEIGRYYTLIVR